MQFRAEAFNGFNHPQFSGINLTTNVTNGAGQTGNAIFGAFTNLAVTNNLRPAGSTSVLGTYFGEYQAGFHLGRLGLDLVEKYGRLPLKASLQPAIRLARAATGREPILKFAGAYHGHADGLLAQAGSGLATQALPSSPGVPASAVSSATVICFSISIGVNAGAVALIWTWTLVTSGTASMGSLVSDQNPETAAARAIKRISHRRWTEKSMMRSIIF